MTNTTFPFRVRWFALLIGIVGLIGFSYQIDSARAAPVFQEPTPTPVEPVKPCAECHLDVADSWSRSPHAHAFDDPVFQEWWQGRGQPGDCLLCHTTSYQETTGAYLAEGVSCEGCHGPAKADHPPSIIPVKADTEYCGGCHTTTLSEWRLTGHALTDVGCMDCHDPHSQKSLFEVSDDMCLNCHEEDMGAYLEDLHIQKGIGCVGCHALVIPPETTPEDGIVPTGHTFTISPATCVACHTDTLHAGFALPGYENGAQEVAEGEATPAPEGEQPTPAPAPESALSPEQQVQALETALASQGMTVLFQGGVIGLALGASTAWFIARNIRQRQSEEQRDEEAE
ncbi:MAG TPA: cytochrome c3 family protein [Anaerolineae bacterium]|nr:cytochrome c3 family protein [Anaerolineae bacterium]